MKYPVPPHPNENNFEKNIGVENGAPIYISKDGSIRANAFIDTSQGGLEYEVDHKKNTFLFKEEVGGGVSIKYIPKFVEKIYEVISKRAYSLLNVFAKIKNRVRVFSTKSLQRYKHAPKTIKMGIDKHLEMGHSYVFTEDSYAGRYIKPHIQSTTFGPYNHNVVIKVTEDVDFINDLLVVRTGSFLATPKDDSIVYISPHSVVRELGTFYTSVGVNYFGDETVTEGQNLDAGITSDKPLVRITSKDFIIKKGTVLSSSPGERDYLYLSATNANNEGTYYSAPLRVDQSPARSYFSKQSSKMYSSHWDGVIPSGAYFSIECWSTNGKYMGYNGELSIVPVNSVPVDIKGECSSMGHGASYEEAKSNADRKAQKMAYQKINSQLMKQGIRKKSSNTFRYNEMILKSAQNLYDKEMHRPENKTNINVLMNPENQDFIYHEEVRGTSQGRKGPPSPEGSNNNVSNVQGNNNSSAPDHGSY